MQSTLTVTPDPGKCYRGIADRHICRPADGGVPSGGPAVAIQNAPVELSVNGKAATQIKTTDANGDFTYTITGISQKTAYDFSVASAATYTLATDDITVGGRSGADPDQPHQGDPGSS